MFPWCCWSDPLSCKALLIKPLRKTPCRNEGAGDGVPDESEAISGVTFKAAIKFGSGEAIGESGTDPGALDGFNEGDPK